MSDIGYLVKQQVELKKRDRDRKREVERSREELAASVDARLDDIEDTLATLVNVVTRLMDKEAIRDE